MEILDLYDEDRLPTGETMVRGEPTPAGRYRLVVHVCIFNSAGEMLIQKRQQFKHGWPGLWDVSMGGAAAAGDTSHSAAVREVREELGLEVDLQGVLPALTVPFRDGFDDFYVLTDDVDPSSLHLQAEEVERVRWAGCEEVLRMIGEGTFIPYHPPLIRLLFYLRDHRGSHMRPDPTKAAH